MKYTLGCPHYTKQYGGPQKRHVWVFEKNEMVHVGLVWKRKRKFVCACGEIQFRTIRDGE